MIRLTRAQRESLKLIYDRFNSKECNRPLDMSYRQFRRKQVQEMICGDGAIIAEVPSMFIAIETDGHRHS